MVTDILSINLEKEVEKISDKVRELLSKKLHKRGLVIAISGGVDSAVCAALAVQAIGNNKVFGILMPEKDSSSKSVTKGKLVVDQLGINYELHDIGSTLENIGCYKWRDEAIKNVFPEYDGTWPNKIAISGGLEGKINHFKLVVEKPDGSIDEQRLGLGDYLQIVSATNYKQRIRKTIEYFHADRLNYAVVGTPNRLEYDQGFFVKNGDGSADIKLIAHLYKTQVYELARFFNLPEEIRSASPTTDTYSMIQGQDEFYFALPYKQMDLALWAHNAGKSVDEAAKLLGITEEQAGNVYNDIEAKRRSTAYLHAMPYLIEDVPQIHQ